jgi:isochorismate synthase
MTTVRGDARAVRPEQRTASVAVKASPQIADALRALAGTGRDGRLVSATFDLARSQAPDPVDLFAVAMRAGLEPTLWLQPIDGFSFVGVGSAWSVRADGNDRFDSVAREWERILAGARIGGQASAARAVGPLLIGGLGFTGEVPADAAWAPFGAAALSVPQLLLLQTPGGTWMTASLLDHGGADASEPDRLARLWDKLAAGADAMADSDGTSPGESRDASPVPLAIMAERPDRRTWDHLVDRFAGAVGRGRLDKVVLARRLDLAAPVEIDAVSAVKRLTAGSPTSTTYAFARRGNVLIGATPERLISTQGKEFQTVAIAGSIRHVEDAGEEAALAAELLASDKDREEHEIVVEMLRTNLEPVATELHVATAPVVATFGTVQHLVTTVTGRLRDRSGILSLAGLLHPTPAVGGEPRELALELITEHESFERGWYAGPLGWVGADGDGEFVVALRCGVVSGRTAALFAGCGIVADSDPAREWEESMNKMQVVAGALGELQP